MLSISDECRFTWDEAGENLAAYPLGVPTALSILSAQDLAALEEIERQRSPTAESVITALSRRGVGQGARETLSGLGNRGVVIEVDRVRARDEFYTPMIYYQMLTDPLKMEAYVRALERAVKPGMTVLDAGAGLGIFGILAARLGAKRVWAIENRPVINIARQLADANGVGAAMRFLRGDLSDPEIATQVGKVDLVVSEFIGDEIFDEGLLAKSVWMRDSFLGGAGSLLPKRLQAFFVPIECQVAATRQHNKVQNVQQAAQQYDIDLGAVVEMVITEGLRNDFSDRLYVPSFAEISAEEMRFLAEPTMFFDMQLDECKSAFVISKSSVEATSHGRLDGVLLFFKVHLDDEVSFSSAPWLRRTHWPQIIYLARGGRSVDAGDVIRVSIAYMGGKGLSVSIN